MATPSICWAKALLKTKNNETMLEAIMVDDFTQVISSIAQFFTKKKTKKKNNHLSIVHYGSVRYVFKHLTFLMKYDIDL